MTERGAEHDPATVAALEDERDHLLASLEDLEREHDAGDLDDADYETLRDGYTARAAAVLRALADESSDGGERSDGSDGPAGSAEAATVGPRERTSAAPVVRSWRGPAIAAVVLLLAAGAGVVVARVAAPRGGGTLTGNDDSARAQLANCQPLAFQDPTAGVECYQQLLDSTPDNVEALTYQGWALIRADQIERGSANLDRAVQLDPDFPDVRVFRAIVASRAGEAARQRGDAAAVREAYTRANDEIGTFYRNDPPQVAVQVLRTELLEFKVFLALLDAPSASCWSTVFTDRGDELALDQALYDSLGTCLDTALLSTPDSVDVLVSRALAELGPERTDTARANEFLDRALTVDPTSSNALLLRAAVALAERRVDDADAALASLQGLPWPTASFLVGTPTDLAGLSQRIRSSTAGGAVAPSTTNLTENPSAGASVSTVPGAPAIPNAGGG